MKCCGVFKVIGKGDPDVLPEPDPLSVSGRILLSELPHQRVGCQSQPRVCAGQPSIYGCVAHAPLTGPLFLDGQSLPCGALQAGVRLCIFQEC